MTRARVRRQVVDDITLKKKLWDALREFGEIQVVWTKTKFSELDFEEMMEVVTGYNKTVMGAERTLPSNNIVPVLKEAVTEFKGTVPVIGDLRNEVRSTRRAHKYFPVHRAGC